MSRQFLTWFEFLYGIETIVWQSIIDWTKDIKPIPSDIVLEHEEIIDK